jgi:hypothetical protein
MTNSNPSALVHPCIRFSIDVPVYLPSRDTPRRCSHVGFLDYFIYHHMTLVSAFCSMEMGNFKDEYRCLFAFMSAYADLSIIFICCARSAYPEVPKQSTNFSQAKNRFVGLQTSCTLCAAARKRYSGSSTNLHNGAFLCMSNKTDLGWL